MPNLEPAESNAKLTRTRNYITNLIGSTSQFGTEEYTLPYVSTSTCINPIKLQLLITCNANLPRWVLKNFTTKCNLTQLFNNGNFQSSPAPKSSKRQNCNSSKICQIQISWPSPCCYHYCYYSISSCVVLVTMARLSRVLDAFAGPSSRSAGACRGGICCPVTPIVEPPLFGRPSTFHMPPDSRGGGCFSGLYRAVRWGALRSRHWPGRAAIAATTTTTTITTTTTTITTTTLVQLLWLLRKTTVFCVFRSIGEKHLFPVLVVGPEIMRLDYSLSFNSTTFLNHQFAVGQQRPWNCIQDRM